MKWKDYRDESRINWGTDASGQSTRDDIKFGCLLRIADGVEKMAINHTKLINEKKHFEFMSKQNLESYERERRRANAYKGIIRKLKLRGPKIK